MKQALNGKANAYGIMGRLSRLLIQTESDVIHVRRTIEMLAGSNGHNGKAHITTMLADALALDEQRVTKQTTATDQPKPGENGHWSKARRAAQAARMRALRKRLHKRPNAARGTTSQKPQNFFGTLYEKIYGYVLEHPEQTVTAIAAGMGEKAPANVSKQLIQMAKLKLLIRDGETKAFKKGPVSVTAALKAGAIKPQDAPLR